MLKIRPTRIGTFNRFFRDNRNKRINLLYGGAGSGKSFSIAQQLIQRFYKEKDIRILVVRKTLPSLRITAYRLILDLLREWHLPFDLNRSELIIRRGENEILFKSLDDPEKIKSYEGNYVWIEEATEVTYQDFMQLNLRTRRKNPNINQIFLSFNPISRYHWLNTELIEKGRNDLAIHHSTYKNNIFLPPEYVAELESLNRQDENFYKIYTLGEFGELKNVIFSNYVVDEFNYVDDVFYGLDFGYNNPSALVECYIRDQRFFVRELLYQTKLTNNDLIQKLKSLIRGSGRIYADAAEPARIEEISQAGFDIVAADKSVIDGIDYLKAHELHIFPDSSNLIDEIRAYKYKEDKDGIVKEEPVKFRDHLIDAMRYAFYSARMSTSDTIPADIMSSGPGRIPGLSWRKSFFR